MPTFTITLSTAAVARLQPLLDRTNADEGAAYTLQDWLILRLKELAIAQELALATESLRDQALADANAAFDAAVRAQRARLLQAL